MHFVFNKRQEINICRFKKNAKWHVKLCVYMHISLQYDLYRHICVGVCVWHE